MLNAPKNNYIEGISKGVFMIRKAKYEDKEQIVRLFKQLHRYHPSEAVTHQRDRIKPRKDYCLRRYRRQLYGHDKLCNLRPHQTPFQIIVPDTDRLKGAC